MKKKKQKEFSKKIFDIVIILFIITIVYSMSLMWKTNNTDGLAYLIPASGGLAATAVGFYFSKAKTENVIKLSKKYNIDVDQVKGVSESEGDI